MQKKSYLILLILLLITTTAVNAYPVTVTDSQGYEVTFEQAPERIVSLIPSNTEILFAVGAGDSVVGVTEHDDYPPEAADIDQIGGYAGFSTEKIIDLEPDLVLGEIGNGEDTLDNLRKQGLTVVTLDSQTLDDIMNNILLVGNITGNDAQAREVVSNMKQVTADIEEQTAGLSDEERPRVLYLVSFEPMYVAGSNSFPDNLISIAGGKNIVAADGWPIISIEDVVEKDPEIIICSGMGGYGNTIKEQLLDNELIAQTTAVKNNHVMVVSDSNIVERPGPRIIEGLEELHAYFENSTANTGTEQETSDSSAQEDAESFETDNSVAGFEGIFALMMLAGAYFCKK